MLTEKQQRYLADFEQLQKDGSFAAEWAAKWARVHEFRDWPSNPEFKAVYAAIKAKYDPAAQ
jgi:hypothetical protein